MGTIGRFIDRTLERIEDTVSSWYDRQPPAVQTVCLVLGLLGVFIVQVAAR